MASYLAPYSMMDAEHPQNKITIVGNPSLGEVKTMMLGVRNNSADIKSGGMDKRTPTQGT